MLLGIAMAISTTARLSTRMITLPSIWLLHRRPGCWGQTQRNPPSRSQHRAGRLTSIQKGRIGSGGAGISRSLGASWIGEQGARGVRALQTLPRQPNFAAISVYPEHDP